MPDDLVNTVTGPIRASDLGVTLPHEHLLVDISCYWEEPADASLRALAIAPLGPDNLSLNRHNPFFSRDNCLLRDLEAAKEEVVLFRELGGKTIVDVTLADIGREPSGLKEIAEATGVNVVVGSGHYVYIAHPAELEACSPEAIAERIVEEIVEGIGETGVRPGVIGEIGTSHPLHPQEAKVLRAAARAHRQTGLPITLHLHPTALAGHEVLDVLEAEGAEPHRVVMGHMDNNLALTRADFADLLAYHCLLAGRGCYIQYDCCGNDSWFPPSDYSLGYRLPSDRKRAEALAVLFERGFGDQVLLSQDICKKTQLVRYGGVGYGHILGTFVSQLREVGFEDAELRTIFVDNPRRMLVSA